MSWALFLLKLEVYFGLAFLFWLVWLIILDVKNNGWKLTAKPVVPRKLCRIGYRLRPADQPDPPRCATCVPHDPPCAQESVLLS
jgi:hypothetical protein